MSGSELPPAPQEADAPEFLETPSGRRLAYHRIAARDQGAMRPGVVFFGGFRSDMTGTKAQHLADWARRTGRGFLRFDYSGHGASSGRFEDGAIGDWAEDAHQALSRLTEGPQICVGSSMGGWIALLTARRAPERVAALVGIAAAPDFTEDLMWAGFSEADRARLAAEGRLERPSEYSEEPEILTRRLIEDGRDNLVLRSPLALAGPVRLLHGSADADVPVSVGLRLLEHLAAEDARLILVKNGDHRLSEPRDLALLTETIEALPT